MDEFEEAFAEAQESEQDRHFNNLTKITSAWTDDQRQAYGEKNPIAIFVEAGFKEGPTFSLSAN